MKAYTPSQRGRALIGGTLCTGLLAGLVALPGYAQSTEPIPEVEPAAEGSELPADARFSCQLYQGEFTVMYQPESQPDQAYPWATPGQLGGGWTAERRCNTISDRLESYRPQGLVDLQVGVENGYDIVCATNEQTPGQCQIVFTVPPGQNPVTTRDRVFENLAQADAGNDTTVVNTFNGNGSSILGEIGEVLNFPTSGRSSNTGINLKPFLDNADGGTGTALRATPSPSRPLNPDNFR